MTDRELLGLFAARDERALTETDAKYGKRCRQIAFSLLGSREDADEIFNDVLMQAWDKLAEKQPERLAAFLAAVTRNLATNRLDRYTAQRRAGERGAAVLEELGDCIPAAETVEQAVDQRMLQAAIRRFLDALPEKSRAVFLLRYHYALPLKDIARKMKMSESNVKITLLRTRKKLRRFLEQEELL